MIITLSSDFVGSGGTKHQGCIRRIVPVGDLFLRTRQLTS